MTVVNWIVAINRRVANRQTTKPAPEMDLSIRRIDVILISECFGYLRSAEKSVIAIALLFLLEIGP